MAMLSAVACAWMLNDTAFKGMGGAAGILERESPVKMVSADIRIKLPSCIVEVNYVFKNTSNKALDVPMGFPEEAVDPDGLRGHSWFKSFQTWVDGKPVNAKVVKLADFSDSVSGGYTRNWWTKQVHFKAGQTVRVRNIYETQPGYQTPGAYFMYIVNTAQNWKGNIDRLRMEVNVDGLPKDSFFNVPWKPHKRKGNTVMWFWEDVEAYGTYDLTVRWPEKDTPAEVLDGWASQGGEVVLKTQP